MEIFVHPTLLTHLRNIGAKRTMLRLDNSDLKTIALGSSHGAHGFDPRYFPDSFNLCCTSQDLKHSFLIYKHVEQHYPHVRNIVLYYSVFSPGWKLEKSRSEKYVSAALNELFGLRLDYEDQELDLEFNKIKDRLFALNFEAEGYRGFIPGDGSSFFPESYGAEKRAHDHLKYNKTVEENLFLLRILLLAKHLGHRVCVVVPPVRSDYKKATGGDFRALFRSLVEILYDFHLGLEVNLVNGFDNPLFLDSYFGDFDHLLPTGKGTEILSKIIYDSFTPR
jgi:hypothetical protein